MPFTPTKLTVFPKGKFWIVSRMLCGKTMRIFETKLDAIDFATRLSIEGKLKLTVYDSDLKTKKELDYKSFMNRMKDIT